MQNITLEELREMHNPEGFQVVHHSKNPTLTMIINHTGEKVWPEMFTSRAKAEYRLYLLLSSAKKKEEAEEPKEECKQPKLEVKKSKKKGK